VIEQYSLGIGAAGVTLENLVLDDQETHETIIPMQFGADNFTIRGCDVMHPANTNTNTEPHGCIIGEAIIGLTVDTCNLLIAPQSSVIVSQSYCIANKEVAGPSSNWLLTNTTMAAIPPVAANSRGGCITLYHATNNVMIDNCTFTTSPDEDIWIYDPNTTFPDDSFENWTIQNSRFLGTTRVTSCFFGNAHKFVNWRIEGNTWKNTKDAAIWWNSSESEIDGLVIKNNLFENIGEGKYLVTDGIIILDNVFFNPGPGQSTTITGNVFRDARPAPQGGWGIWCKANGPGPIIGSNVFDHIREACVLVAGSNVIVEGFGLDRPTIVDNTIMGNEYGGIVLRDDFTETNPVVENNVISDCFSYGISHEGLATGASIRFNDITGCGTGIQNAGANSLIRGNEVYNSVSASDRGGGISIAPYGEADDDPTNDVIAYNLTTGNAGCGIRAATTWTTLTVTGLQIYNNTIVSNLNTGIIVGQDNVNVYNNIIAFQTGAGIQFAATVPGVMGYNLFFNEASGGTNFVGFPGSTTFSGDILEENPLFEDFFNLDFHLQAGSPAIQSGAVLAGTSLVAGGIDRGAYPTGTVSASVKEADWTLYR